MKKKDASVSTYGVIIWQNMKNPTVEILIAIYKFKVWQIKHSMIKLSSKKKFNQTGIPEFSP